MLSTASQAKTCGQPVPQLIKRGSPKPTTKMRKSTAKAALFTATAMYVVVGVGAPSYASGVHMWKGTALILNASPATTSASATKTTGAWTTLRALANRSHRLTDTDEVGVSGRAVTTALRPSGSAPPRNCRAGST